MSRVKDVAIAALLHDIGKFGQRADLYQKNSSYKDRNYKYVHAAFSAQILNESYFSLGDIADIAAGHHAPSNDEEWAVACGDRMANAFEIEDYNSVDSEDFKTQRLWHLFDKKKQFAIDVLSPDTIFAESEKSPTNEYDALWKKFKADISRASEYGNRPIDSFTIEYLMRKYCSFIPSSTSFSKEAYEEEKANIPLYEHSKATAVFSVAVQKLLESGNRNIVDYYKDKSGDINQKDLLYIAGDFFGIQKFIFDFVPVAKASKILRAKSAYIQILTKVVALYITRELELDYQSIISTNAGKFEILGINTPEAKGKLRQIQKELDSFFISRYFGETGIGVSFVESSLADFVVKGRYKDSLRKEINEAVEAAKFRKFDLLNTEAVLEYDNGLDNQSLCPLCSKRKKIDNEACGVCASFVKMGEKLAKSKFMKITTDGSHEAIEIFGGYFVQFGDKESVFVSKDTDIAIFDIENDEEFRGYAKWELKSFVATKADGEVLTFEDLAKKSCGGGETGIKAIMSLKGDVDGMGNFIKTSYVTNSFARYNFFARLVDYFFSVYASHKMKRRNIYTVFAGGDDIFILGAWDEVIEFAKELREDFMRFTNGSELTISMGLVLTKPNKSINFVAHMAEEALEEAKAMNGKDAITIFGETIKWVDYLDDNGLIEELLTLEGEKLTTALLYRLLELVNMSKNIKDDIKNALWKSKLVYSFTRNIGSGHDKLLALLNEMIERHPSETKAYLSELIYKRRSSV